jgi:hypothetical protein
MSETFVGVIVFHCRLDYCRQRNLTHQYPWAKANMAIDVRNIYWGDCFALSIGILSPTEFRSPADLSRGFSRFIAGFHPIYRGVFLSPTKFNCPVDLSRGNHGFIHGKM